MPPSMTTSSTPTFATRSPPPPPSPPPHRHESAPTLVSNAMHRHASCRACVCAAASVGLVCVQQEARMSVLDAGCGAGVGIGGGKHAKQYQRQRRCALARLPDQSRGPHGCVALHARACAKSMAPGLDGICIHAAACAKPMASALGMNACYPRGSRGLARLEARPWLQPQPPRWWTGGEAAGRPLSCGPRSFGGRRLRLATRTEMARALG